jgi:hypothetical protein
MLRILKKAGSELEFLAGFWEKKVKKKAKGDRDYVRSPLA